ncbi:MAG: TetR/AcrR family transcriptional regulator [Nitrospiraceae bacterium]|nr:MAG: TetR/AcrR family transcriptional regulator [Nitrospiraceae bacterium]
MNKISVHQADTKERILDAAEYLFAMDGYRGTSLREITGRATVNLAAVNYHFGSKKILVEEVIKRRLLPLNNIRQQRLEQVKAVAQRKGKKPDIKSVLSAFIEPTLKFKEANPGAEHFFTFIGRSFTDPDTTVRDVFMRYIKPLFMLLHETACSSLPDHSEDIIFWRLHFTLGALFHTIHLCGHMKTEFINREVDMDADSLINLIVPYVTSGMKAK